MTPDNGDVQLIGVPFPNRHVVPNVSQPSFNNWHKERYRETTAEVVELYRQ